MACRAAAATSQPVIRTQGSRPLERNLNRSDAADRPTQRTGLTESSRGEVGTPAGDPESIGSADLPGSRSFPPSGAEWADRSGMVMGDATDGPSA